MNSESNQPCRCTLAGINFRYGRMSAEGAKEFQPLESAHLERNRERIDQRQLGTFVPV
jgi:hypothetical protein